MDSTCFCMITCLSNFQESYPISKAWFFQEFELHIDHHSYVFFSLPCWINCFINLIAWSSLFFSFAGMLNFAQICLFHWFCFASLCRGVDLNQWKELLRKEAEPADLDSFVRHLSENHVFPNKVLVDCTADTYVASHYYDWLKKGIHVITPNKKANSGPLDRVIFLLARLV